MSRLTTCLRLRTAEADFREGFACLFASFTGWQIVVAPDVADFNVETQWAGPWFAHLAGVVETAGLCMYTDTRAAVIEIQNCESARADRERSEAAD